MDQMVRNVSHVIAYRSLELLFGTHTFHFYCFFEDFNCVFTQIRCLSRVLFTCINEFIKLVAKKTTIILGKPRILPLFLSSFNKFIKT